MFELFRLPRFLFHIKAGPESLFLPLYKGAIFRKGFGSVFRRISCAAHRQDYQGCELREEGPYAYIFFETAPPLGPTALHNYENIPPLSSLSCPWRRKGDTSRGETLPSYLLLFGRAMDFLLIYFILFADYFGLAARVPTRWCW